MPKTNQISATSFLLFFIFPIVHSKGCSDSFCGNVKSLPIRHPFQLQGQNQKDCDYLALNLTCSDAQGVPLLNLPSFGDLYARDINYSANVIQLYPSNDNNCLASRFLSPDISYSPLIAVSYQNYTFFGCPRGNSSSSNFTAIGCLSNSTFSVLATSSISRAEDIISLGCNVMVTVPIPVSSPLQYEFNGFDGDLMLKWNVKTCKACVKKKRHGAGYVVLLVFLSLILPNVFAVLLYGLFVALIYLIRWIRKIIRWVADRASLARATRSRNRNQINLPVWRAPPPPPPPPPSNVTAGSGNNTAVNRFKTICLGESGRIPGPNSTTCPICLEEYNPTETVKSITQCGHCFHESCIDLWLRTHSSCPICRNDT